MDSLTSNPTYEEQEEMNILSAQAERMPAATFAPGGDVVWVGDEAIGGGSTTVIAGPCAVESREQLLATAHAVRAAGATLLRGGAYKPRTSPDSFQGLGAEALDMLAEAKAETGLPVVTEVLDVRELERIATVADMLQVGARNMQNFPLLRELGAIRKPVLLKRGPCATFDELLSAAAYLLAGGNRDVVLCERGIRTFEHAYRYTLDVAAAPVLRERTRLPVLVDPSHPAGCASRVLPLALAGVAAGADGVILEAHPNPLLALCDGQHAVSTSELGDIVRAVLDVGQVARSHLSAGRIPAHRS